MIKRIDNIFFLNTKTTSYIFNVTKNGHLQHLHYGAVIAPTKYIDAFIDKHSVGLGNTIAYSQEDISVVMEDSMCEVGTFGKGDIRETFVSIIKENGSNTVDFIFEDAVISKQKTEMETLPTAMGGEELVVTLKEKTTNIRLVLYYTVYEDANVITRRAEVINKTDAPIILDKMMSTELDFADNNYDFYTFGGAWTREMNMYRHELNHGKVINSSLTGTSSNKSNPFTMVARRGVTEESGECYGLNLIYSGNHYTACESTFMGKLRVVAGINPEGFRFYIGKGQKFESPEAVMTFSRDGFSGVSKNMHYFVNNHVVRGKWAKKERPVLLNSWEAAYFDINESKLVHMAKAAADLGVELFVMDDGWFGERNDDASSLGDWDYNPKKLPHGVKGLAEKIHKLGLMFGIWIEPEMINEKSKLYKEHPDWAIRVPGEEHSEGRNQMLLDLTRDDVCQFIMDKMDELFSSADINYVKWDMNRTFSDVYSTSLSPNKQGEVYHRYVMGLYKVMGYLVNKHPDILFEACASGGNRFDLGMLCYMPQIWASDNTDPYQRSIIQTGVSYGYPQSVIGAHVSGSPNHQTLRKTSLETRFDVACFGALGYELNPLELTKNEKECVKEQIEFYKKNRRTFQFGEFYRIKSGEKDNLTNGQYKWLVVSPDKEKAFGMFIQGLAMADYVYADFKATGLDPAKLYHFTNRRFKYNIKEFGDLINTVAPFHVKRDSLVHNIVAAAVKMDNEKTDCLVPGDILMNSGVKLEEAYAGTGYNEHIRLFRDCEARMYSIEAQ